MKFSRTGIVIGVLALVIAAGLVSTPTLRTSTPIAVSIKSAPPAVASKNAPDAPSGITADDIAGTGTEISDAAKPKEPAVDIDLAALEVEAAARNLETALLAVAGTDEMKRLRSNLLPIPSIEKEYVAARKSGADANRLREIASRLADHADGALELWRAQGGALKALRTADLAFADANWKLFRADKSRQKTNEVESKFSKTVTDWQAVDRIRVKVSLHIDWDLREAMAKRADNGESTDETARKRELLKLTVVYLESIVF
ncbi:MAG: hypothetical protein SGJ27_10365 [Candidatus Melainabacteria bacterium]|nr:hypothetical protein [Candidatus Melainabacteria bacterium]